MSDDQQTPPDDQNSTPETEAAPPVKKASVFARLRAYFFAGVLVTAPAFITIYFAWWLVGFIDQRIVPLIPAKYNPEQYLPFTVPGLGLVVLVIFLTLVGALTAGFLGRWIVRLGENMLNRMPVIRNIYGAIKQIFETVLEQRSSAFRQVVLVEYPRRGIWAIGFVSGTTQGEVQNLTEDEMVNIFLPTTPNPTSGFLLFVPRKDLTVLHMTVEEGIKMVVSGGIVTPKDPRSAKEKGKAQIASVDRDAELIAEGKVEASRHLSRTEGS